LLPVTAVQRGEDGRTPVKVARMKHRRRDQELLQSLERQEWPSGRRSRSETELAFDPARS